MKKVFFSIVSIFFVLICFAQEQFVVDEHAQMREVGKSFHAIKVSGGIDLYLSQSGEEAIAVSASEEKFIANIKTIVEDNTLKISFSGNNKWNNNRKLIVYVSFINLEKLEASGASDITVAGTIKSNNLTMQLSGASHFKGVVSLNALDMGLSGASEVDISGLVTTLTIDNSGASDMNGYGLATDVCIASASGASDIYVTVNKELTVNASGASNFLYQGDAVIKEIRSSGASTVSKKK